MRINPFQPSDNSPLTQKTGSPQINRQDETPVSDTFIQNTDQSNASAKGMKFASITSSAAEKVISGGERLRKVWETDMGSSGIMLDSEFRPAICNDGVIVSKGGFVHKLDSSGKEVWKTKISNSNTMSEPASDKNGNVYAFTNNSIVSLDSAGNIRWEKHTGNMNSGAPLVTDDGRIFTLSTDNRLSCFDNNGNEMWSLHTNSRKGSDFCKPFLDDQGKIHVGTDRNASSFYTTHMVIDTNTAPGTTPKPFEIDFGGNTSTCNVSVDSNGVSYGLKSGNFTAIDSNGETLWSVPLTDSSTLQFSKVGNDGKVYAGVGNHTLVCFDKTGNEQWRLKAAPGSESFGDKIEVNTDGTAFIAANKVDPQTRMGKATLIAINPDGTRRWEKDTSYSPILLAGKDGTIYAGDAYKRLEAFDPKTGGVIGSTPLNAGRGSIKIADNNDILSANSDGIVRMHHFTNIKESAKAAMDELVKPADAEPAGEKLTVKVEQDNVVIGNIKIPINRKRN
ncbi:MAG: PQQ-binding-like beta-propeller repeat protein [Firmicutes bacterium]|nr:PQQ-binding-like beta-propeller repeat protein [Bacillota bacterium]